jgi:BirA family biotin operon repressor/biotin-[acetyl-CoA-carboxylase] ligase
MVGGKLPCLITANAQTAGRGRRGKTFYSPHGVGLYFSLVFPWEREESAALVTTMAAVAVCRVLENEIGIVADIKWVNDIFLDGKKIGGILTEAIPVFDSENEKAIVLGIGINLERPEGGYPAELQERAGALSDVLDRSNVSADMTAVFVDEQADLAFNRNVLIAMMINELTKIVRALPDRDYLDEYRERCFIIGKEIFLDDGRAIVPFGISDDGALMYRDENGQNRELISGEVSLVRY